MGNPASGMPYSERSPQASSLLGLTYYIRTFGCQMNEQDSLRMGSQLGEAGCREVHHPEEADILIVNTCSIRRKAEEKAYSVLGRYRLLKRRRPEAIVVVAGCVAQQAGEALWERMPHIDVVAGPYHVRGIDSLVSAAKDGKRRVVALSMMKNSVTDLDCRGVCETPGVRAYITIMEGCTNFCAFCIVPYVRGEERNRPVESLIGEARELVEQKGVREITLLGQNVNAYRAPDRKGYAFADLLQDVSRIAGLERLRFTTCHPKDLSQDLISCLGEIEKVCEHIHLPLQSGSDRILVSMNRGYTGASYLDKIQALRARVPRISITSDMIVGFPGEDSRDFDKTIERMREIRFDSVFSFKYSPRPGTYAAGLKDDVPAAEKARRLAFLQRLQRGISLEINMALQGETLRILVEGRSRDGVQWMGRTRTNKVVNFQDFNGQRGDQIDVLIERGLHNSLLGRLPTAQ